MLIPQVCKLEEGEKENNGTVLRQWKPEGTQFFIFSTTVKFFSLFSFFILKFFKVIHSVGT